MTILQAKDAKFGAGICSLCDAAAVTFGQQKHGGVRYCQTCFKETLSWHQLGGETMQKAMMILWDKVAALPAVQKALGKISTLDPDTRKAIGDGETLKRLYESEAPGRY